MNRVVWYARPGVVLSLLLVLVVLSALFAKTPVSGRDGDPRLLSTSTDPMGAALFFELANRLGYDTRRENSPDAVLPSGAIVTELDPIRALTPGQVHRLLQHVRSGGALLAVLGLATGALSDSLRINVDPFGRAIETRQGDVRSCGRAIEFTRTGLWLGEPTLLGLKVPDSRHGARRTFILVGATTRNGGADAPRPAMIGVPFGAGRIVVASDPDVFRNDALRNCAYGLDVAAAAALHYLTEGGAVPRRTLVFDDSHLTTPVSNGSVGVVKTYLVRTASGRFFSQLCLAGLVLLLAAAPRVLVPRAETRIERRSPLEHVDALARAYGQVGATRTGTLRLVRGLERRVGTARRGADHHADELFLTRVAESTLSVASDVALVRHAMTHAVDTKAFVEVGHAIGRIEQALTHT